MNFKKLETSQKLRGGYYTPQYLSDFICNYIVNKKCKNVLEPSFGDGSFLKSLNTKNKNISVDGVEIDKEEFDKVNKNSAYNLINADFLSWYLNNGEKKKYDAIVGNPPFVRYQYLDNQLQKQSEKIFKKFNLSFTMHTNLWVPFFLASIDLLKPGGKLGMVVPNEILYLPHAKSLRHFFKDYMKDIIILDTNELLFKETLQGTSIIFATKKNKKKDQSRIAIKRIYKKELQNKNNNKILNSLNFKKIENYDKWLIYLLSKKEIDTINFFSNHKQVSTLKELASVDVGIVTGANNFFLISKNDVKKYNLKKYVKYMFGRSNHCKGVIYDEKQLYKNIDDNLPSFFLQINEKTKINNFLKSYIKIGEKRKLHKRYKCRIRKPWYVVPSVYATQLALLKRSHKYPRLIFNKIKAFTTDTAYRIKIPKSTNPKKLSYCFVNSLTALTAELEGRHYGGGVLELTPSEIEKLLIPFPKKIEFSLNDLNNKFINKEKDNEILLDQDKSIAKSLKVNLNYLKILNKALRKLQDRRLRNEH